MRGIPEELLNKKYASLTNEVYLFNAGKHEMLKELMQECQELQEPWMTLDEFLKSGFVGLCFVFIDGVVEEAKFYGHKFAITQPYGTIKSIDKYQATKVMPIHKPEPPR